MGQQNPHEYDATDVSTTPKDVGVQRLVYVYVTDNSGILSQDPPTVGPTLATKHEIEQAFSSTLLQDGLYVALPSPDTEDVEV
mgnify:CR=1 FL=1